MCFVNKGEWQAMVNEEEDTTATTETYCDECGTPIKIGQFMHTIHQQESECCQTCENKFCECEGDCCQCDEPDFGETFDYKRCEQCDKFLKAIEAAEIEAGCLFYQSRPMLLDMINALQEGGAKESKKYYRKAIVMFPELSGYLQKLWRQMFGN